MKTPYQFQLFAGQSSKTPLSGVAYSVLARGQILVQGKTTAQGKTAVFEVDVSTMVRLLIFNPKMNNGKGGYLVPSVHEYADAGAILLNNPTVDQLSRVGSTPLNFEYGLPGSAGQRTQQSTPLVLKSAGNRPSASSQPVTPMLSKPPPVKVVALRLKSHIMVELKDHLKHSYKTRLNYDVLDRNGVILRENNRELKQLRTRAAGLTGQHYSEQPLKFRFYGGDLGKVRVVTEAVQPFFEHQGLFVTQYVKTVQAVTAPDEKNTVLLAGKKNIPVIVDPVSNEIYVLSPDDFRSFNEISTSLSTVFNHLHQSRERLNTLMALESRTPEQIREAEKNMGIAQDEAIQMLNQKFKNKADLKEVLAFELFTTADGQQKLNAVRKYTSQSQHLQNKNNRQNKFEYQLKYQVPWKNSPDTPKAGIREGTAMTIDSDQFKEKFMETIQDIHVEIYKTKGGKSATWVPDPKIFGITSTELAESYKTSESSTVDVQAQWLRLVAGTGYDGTVKWGTKGFQASGSAYAQARMVLLEGKKKWLWAYPSLNGWIMEVDDTPLGAIRFICGAEIYGFAGAVFAASAAFAVTAGNEGTSQMLSSVARDPKATIADSVRNGRSVLKLKKGQMDDKISPDNHFNAGIDAFAGMQASITPFGGLQWLDPENPKDFTDLARISPTLGLSAGIGGSADFKLYYKDGAFRFRASIAACYGVGGKGSLEFMVDFKNISMLIRFIAYQLTYASFKHLIYMLHDDFMLLHKVSMMLPFENENILTSSIQDILDRFKLFTSRMQVAEQRIKIVRKINSDVSQWLKYLSPESRGCYLYHITRHGLISRMLDPAESEGWWLMANLKEHELPEHKQAVINLFKSVTVVSHWTNTLQHMSPEGEKSSKSIAENEKELLQFLNLGSNGVLPLANLQEIIALINQDHAFPANYRSGNTYIDEYLKMRGQRILAYPKDYKIASFNTQEFRQVQIAQHLQKPELFMAKAPRPIEELDMESYTSTSKEQTWMA
ncbi:hypothetical protein [Acinetobacter sp. WZC-1]|uniref:hypothetical protein n=1 Tax=Acinetobacter sp. WZC-1 TaxID=3459034 RepID=UPI00403D6216